MADHMRFEPARVCIYCGSRGVSLSQEHIIPLGLNGNLLLPEASCEACSKATQKIEEFCLKKMLINTRTRHKLRTRRPKNRPKSFVVDIGDPSGATAAKVVSVDYLPTQSFAMPAYDLPGMVQDEHDDSKLSREILASMSAADAEGLVGLGGGTKPVAMTIGTIDFRIFDRMLAKIAHSYAYAMLGPTGFEPRLANLIRYGGKASRLWVGGYAKRYPPSQHLWEIGMGEMRSPSGKTFTCVAIRLFSWMATPIYVIAVGERHGGLSTGIRPGGHCASVNVDLVDMQGRPLPSQQRSWGPGLHAYLMELNGPAGV